MNDTQSPTAGADKAGSPDPEPNARTRMFTPNSIASRRPASGSAGPSGLRLGPWVVLLLALSLTAGLWLFERREVDRAERARFDAAAGKIAHQLEERLVSSEITTRAAASMAAARLHHLTEDEWERFVERLDLNTTTFDGATGLGIALRVEPDELAAHVAQMRRTRPDYTVVPPGVREVHFPLVGLKQIDSVDVARRPLGYDGWSDPTRRDAIERAAATGTIAYTRALVQPTQNTERESDAFVILYSPAFEPGAGAEGRERTVHDLHALTVTRIRLAPLLDAVVKSVPGITVSLSITDLSGKPVVVATHADGRPSRDIPPSSVTLRRGGIDFELRMTASTTFHASHDDPFTTLIPVVGIAGSLALFGVVLLLDRRGRREVALLTTEVDQTARRFRDFADAAPFPIWFADPSLRVTYLNPAWQNTVGDRAAANVLAHGWSAIVHPDDVATVAAKTAEVMDQPGGFSGEYRLQHADGSYRWHSVRGQPMRDGTGTVTGFMGMSLDIQAIREAESEREAGLRWLEELIDSMPMPMGVKDASFRIVFANAALCQRLGTPARGRRGPHRFRTVSGGGRRAPSRASTARRWPRTSPSTSTRPIGPRASRTCTRRSPRSRCAGPTAPSSS